MGSNIDLRIISIALVISLLVGVGAGYMVGNSPISGYKEEVDRLETINLGISGEKAQLLDENKALQDQLEDYQDALIQSASAFNDLLQNQMQLNLNYEELEGLKQDLQQSYTELEEDYNKAFSDYTRLVEKYNRLTEREPEASKSDPEGQVVNYLSGVCGQDYRLISPENSDLWEVNITIVSELSDQYVHIRIYEAIGDYPYNYEEQIYAPSASAKHRVTLVAKLDVSKNYEVWVRDAYAKPFTGSIEEIWRPYIRNRGFEEKVQYDPWNIPGWGGEGTIGVYKGYYGKAIYLHQQRHGSDAVQDIYCNSPKMELSFWMRPFPQNHEVSFQFLFDGRVVFDEKYIGSNDNYDWQNVKVELNNDVGFHELRFHVLPGSDYYPEKMSHVAIDEVTLLSSTT